MGVAFTFTVVLQNRKTDVDHATGLKRAPHSQGALVRVRVTTAARRAWELGRVGQVLFERANYGAGVHLAKAMHNLAFQHAAHFRQTLQSGRTRISGLAAMFGRGDIAVA